MPVGVYTRIKGRSYGMMGKHHTEKSKQKSRESHKDQIPWNKGKINCFSEETIKNIIKAKMGNKNPRGMMGKHHSSGSNRKNSDSHKNNLLLMERYRNSIPANKGKTYKQLFGEDKARELKENLSKSIVGENHPNWQGGITSANKQIRNSPQYKLWCKQVRIKDNFTCQGCGQKGGILRAHHIKSFSKLWAEARELMPLLSPVEAAFAYPPLWDVSNGVTLCEECHWIEHRKCKKTDKEVV